MKIYYRKLSLLTIILLCFFTGCHKKNDLSNSLPAKFSYLENKNWISKFLEDFFLDTSAIYTLLGSKPMSGTTIDISTESECLGALNSQLKATSRRKREKKIREIHDYYKNNDMLENWKKWIELDGSMKNPDFLFRLESSQDPHFLNANIINVSEVVTILKKYQDEITEEIGMKFDPEKVAREFENMNSDFWKMVFQSHFVQGILYGFGEQNARLFSEQMKINMSSTISGKSTSEIDNKRGVRLPRFSSYASDVSQDAVVQKYKAERAIIQSKIKGKNFSEVALSRLLKDYE